MAARSLSRPPTAPTVRAGASARTLTTSAPDRSLTPEHERARRLADPEERRSVRRAMTLGAFVWPAFFLVDLYLGLVVYPGAPIALYAGFRLLGEVAIFAVYRESLRKDISSRRLKATNALVCALCSVLISVMALRLGGLGSPYIHGLSLVIFVEALAVPAPWRDTVWYAAPSVASFPAIVLVASLFDPALASALRDGAQLAELGAHYVILLAAATIAAASGQVGWSARMQLRKARRLGRYRLEARIGEGGMNEVWLAWDESLQRNVALKILRSSAETDGRVLARFEREALALSRLTSPHTVRVFDFGASDDGVSFIAMEYLPGADLQQLVRESGPMPPERAIALAIQACRSLAEAHAAGIVHRDVKPANLFVTRMGDQHDVLKVLDFGIARLVSDTTRTQSVRGTPAYMPPECWMDGEADARSDVYALGATLYYLLSGHPPFEGSDAAQLVRAHLLQSPDAPSKRRGEPLPAALDDLVLCCLAKSPSDRVGSVGELEAALADCASALERTWSGDDARAAWLAREREKDEERMSLVASSGPR
ncbi:MAG: serine/threonine protein kinase [Labilithrix sp.]|nr:serine/threonine protein kinase [Labilithrix sp.]